jgi:sugar phosphate isomerase/epimerase
MKLAFTTNRWNGTGLDQFLQIAREYGFSGLELHGLSALDAQSPASVYPQADCTRS